MVRRYHNEPSRQTDAPAQGMRGPGRAPLRAPGLDTNQGLNRFVWDFSIDGPARANGEPAGMLRATPGAYVARLTLGSWQAEAGFDLVSDPAVEAEGVSDDDLMEQFLLGRRILVLSGAAADLGERVDSLLALPVAAPANEGNRDRRRRLAGSEADPRADLEAVKAELETDNSDSYPPPMLMDQIGYLRSMVMGADQRPGNHAYERLDSLQQWFNTLKARVDSSARQLETATGANE